MEEVGARLTRALGPLGSPAVLGTMESMELVEGVEGERIRTLVK